MTDCIHTLFSAWGDPSPEARATATDAAIGPEFYYSDPNAPAPIHDRDDYLAYIQMFGDMAPGATAKVVDISEKHGHARATVDFVINEHMTQRGQYFVDLKDGKIARIIGFAGMGEPS
jgi:hypothetical protein